MIAYVNELHLDHHHLFHQRKTATMSNTATKH